MKQRALVDLEQARLSLALHTGSLSAEMSPAAIVERSFKKHRVAWIVSATLVGAVALRLVLSSSSAKNERDNFGKSGTKGRLFRMLSVPLITMGKQAAFDFATQYFKNHFKQPSHSSSSEQDPI